MIVNSSQWSADEQLPYFAVHDAVTVLLSELEGLGFRWKRVRIFDFNDQKGGAGWCGLSDFDGQLTVFRDCHPGAVAHELGHGFHECLRKDHHLPLAFGEEYAEAIRWFVEQRTGGSEWFRQMRIKGTNADILDACDWDFKQFKGMLADGRFYPA